ncbi:hypothetical protein [Tropicimonas sediminicola]|uniref:Uncharacterized protein n=1 Tax=Tropicimonas sediminicola TaxID=1031541 RepID=A0A239H2A0_9RHOB|nr:hypothetical protein [Tropicimonas sediminicola]SNS75255.1 hypothetical protein SAMN05421757_103207 [Tropicimonas sediminicola]
MNRLAALIAFLVLAGFLVILAIEVPSLDLILVIVLTLGLAAYDFFGSTRKPRQ